MLINDNKEDEDII